ncbi:MAG: U32 family peptidase [Corallococcus sp.]|nr:U32 family peptidase [Corallococcus sp.]MCM1359653.1 U32 family peptidase [Corallococcus sp.]MCM1395362.1 U32 family peptidase [Corallococcus sp.]
MSNIITKKLELLAPAGNMEKLKTAFHFGADAVYLAGKQYGLRAFADNFSPDEIAEAVQYAHALGKKVYVTVNIFAKNGDFDALPQYLNFLEKNRVDAVLVSDVGVMDFVLQHSNLPVHVSTQANTTNAYAVNFWRKLGAERVVLARELSVNDVKQIHEACPEVQLEAFVHGAMCISYSGRCLLSNYLVNRDGNRGECVQACRWQWYVKEVSRTDELPVMEDERGTYIFNSKDMNMLAHLPSLIDAGVVSFKIEGRMKSAFYVATVVSAYRRALDAIAEGRFSARLVCDLLSELDKASHREYTTGFYFNEDASRQYYEDSRAKEEYKFIAVVKGVENGVATVEQRNKFQIGDNLEILSKNSEFTCQNLRVDDIITLDGSTVAVANRVQQVLKIPCRYPLSCGDILRKKV